MRSDGSSCSKADWYKEHRRFIHSENEKCTWKDMANAMSFFRHNRIDKNALVK